MEETAGEETRSVVSASRAAEGLTAGTRSKILQKSVGCQSGLSRKGRMVRATGQGWGRAWEQAVMGESAAVGGTVLQSIPSVHAHVRMCVCARVRVCSEDEILIVHSSLSCCHILSPPVFARIRVCAGERVRLCDCATVTCERSCV